MKINLSVIIPVYNAKKTLRTSINSVINQEIKIKNFLLEIILIIDDGKRYEKIIPQKRNGVSIKIIKTLGIKTGPGNARNLGIKKANGKYIGFLDADDEWSKNYINNMYKLVKQNGIAFAPTKVFEKNKEMFNFTGKDPGYLQLSDIGEVPCSFHPFILKTNHKGFKSIKSQDVYNTAYILARSNRKIKMIDNGFYKLNIQKESVTKEYGFSHKINIAYKKYQLISEKDKVPKVSRQFALRRIMNLKFIKWQKIYKGDFYSFLSEEITK
jgi:glycosyltransferase involved in cell wall biosynthesis